MTPNTKAKIFYAGILSNSTLGHEDEIRQAFDQDSGIWNAYIQLSDLRNLSAFLQFRSISGCCRRILKSSTGCSTDFRQIYSEVQLLGDVLATHRIEGESDGERPSVSYLFLSKLHVAWLKKLSLSVRREDVYERASLYEPAKQTAWNNLLSDEILTKVSSTGQRIAFSHNILFDYAISVLLIEDDSQQLEDFILEDESRPLFLRPSLTYFFTRLWYKAPDTFWKAFWHVFPSNHSVHLRLVARLIPTGVIANEARRIGQLTPLLDKLERAEEISNEATMWLLQSVRALEIKRDPLWIDFFDKASSYLHADFVWDLATLTSDIFERARDTDNTTVINTCGQIGRRLLVWVWREREATVNSWYNRLGSYQAVPLVAKTYETNVEESRTLLENVLDT